MHLTGCLITTEKKNKDRYAAKIAGSDNTKLDPVLRCEYRSGRALVVFPNDSETMRRDVDKARYLLLVQCYFCLVVDIASGRAQCFELGC